MPHKRSKLAKMKRALSRHVSRHAHRDTDEPRETINKLTPGQAINFLEERFGESPLGIALYYEPGEVLSDTRGRGTLQQIGETE